MLAHAATLGTTDQGSMMLDTSIPHMTRCCTILLIDDDQNILNIWSTILRPLAHVSTAATLSDGLEKLKEADILILDWRLDWGHADPILDRWIEEKDGPIAVVSGWLDQDARYQLYTRGVWNTFEKPIPNETLLSVVRRYMRVVRLQKSVAQHEQDIAAIRNRYDKEITKLKRYIAVLAIALFGTTIAPEVIYTIIGLL